MHVESCYNGQGASGRGFLYPFLYCEVQLYAGPRFLFGAKCGVWVRLFLSPHIQILSCFAVVSVAPNHYYQCVYSNESYENSEKKLLLIFRI